MSLLDKYMNQGTGPLPIAGQGTGSLLDKYMDSTAVVQQPQQQDPNLTEEGLQRVQLPALLGVPAAAGAGIVRGFTEPLSILPPARWVTNQMKRFYGDTPAEKVAYSMGFLGGAIAPSSVALKVGGYAVRGLSLADDAAKLAWKARAVQGAVAGALWGAGRAADSPEEYIKHVLGDAALGGIGDVLIPPAWAALSARFGTKVNPKVEQLLNAADVRSSGQIVNADEHVTSGAVKAHAQAMQLFEQMYPAVTATPMEKVRVPAVRANGKVYIGELGEIHADIVTRNGLQDLDSYQRNIDAGIENGYATNLREFVTRKEATELVNSAGAIDKTKLRPVEWEYFVSSSDDGGLHANMLKKLKYPKDVDTEADAAATRLNVKLGLESLPWADLTPGQIHLVPTPHGDTADLQRVLGQVDGLTSRFVKYGDSEALLVARGLPQSGWKPQQAVQIRGLDATTARTSDYTRLEEIPDELDEVYNEVFSVLKDGAAKGMLPQDIVELNRDIFDKLGARYIPNVMAGVRSGGVTGVDREWQQNFDVTFRALRQQFSDPDAPVTFKPVLNKLDQLAEEFNQHGFIRGQAAVYIKDGQEWMIQAPTKNGVRIVRPGEKPKNVKLESLALLNTADDLDIPSRISDIGPVAAEFVQKYSLWPGEDAAEFSFGKALQEFTLEKGLSPKDRDRLNKYVGNMQKRVLAAEDPTILGTMARLNMQAAELGDETADGLLDQLTSIRGLVYQKAIDHEGRHVYTLYNKSGQIVSPPNILDERQTIEWLRSYQYRPEDLVGSPLANGVMPPGPPPTQKPHSALGATSPGELNLSAMLAGTSKALPRKKVLQWIEDLALRDNVQVGGRPFRPYTEIFVPLSNGKVNMRNDSYAWEHGGKDLAGAVVTGLRKIITPKAIRKEHKAAWVELFESPYDQWQNQIARLDLSKAEVRTALDAREWVEGLWDARMKPRGYTVPARDFIDYYMPTVRAYAESDVKNVLAHRLQTLGKTMDEKALEFAQDMARVGMLEKWQRDPYLLMQQYLRAVMYDQHLKVEVKDALTFSKGGKLSSGVDVERLPSHTPDERLVKELIDEFITLNAYGAPETMLEIETFISKVGESLWGKQMDGATKTRMINTFMSMNYGAYMGFRPGLVIRNMTQTLVTTYPTLGGKYTLYGLKRAMRSTLHPSEVQELVEAGAIIRDHIPSLSEDLRYAAVYRAKANSKPSNFDEKFERFSNASARLTEFSLRWFRKSDDFNRAVAYFGAKKRMIDAWNKHDGRITDEFFRDSGLNYHGDAIKQQMREMNFSNGEDAGRWIGKLTSDDTQWVYQLGAGPAYFSHGVGRVAGQYGTWASWFTSFLAQGGKNLKGAQKAAFGVRGLLAHAAIVGAGAAVGWNTSRWTGLSSLSWMGGPAVDWASDIRDVITGVQQSGDASANRTIALSRWGFKDDGEGISMLPHIPIGAIPDPVNGRLVVDDPALTALGFFGTFTPGFLAAKDIMKGTGTMIDGDVWSGLQQAFNLPVESAGSQWPAMRVR